MNERGFTLMEVIIVAAIIGILAALAIPNYAMFKGNAYNAMASSDARNLAPAADFASSKGFVIPSVVYDPLVAGPIDPVNLPGGTKSPGVWASIDLDANHYTVMTEHGNGDRTCYIVDSELGSFVKFGGCV